MCSAYSHIGSFNFTCQTFCDERLKHWDQVCLMVPFGMGVDCPDIRQIVHVGLPDDVSKKQAELAEMVYCP